MVYGSRFKSLRVQDLEGHVKIFRVWGVMFVGRDWGGKPGVEAEPADPEEERAHEDPGLKI